MKWKIMAALPLVPAVLLAQKINLAEYKEESAKNTEYEIIYTENFNTSAPGWILPAGGRLEKEAESRSRAHSAWSVQNAISRIIRPLLQNIR